MTDNKDIKNKVSEALNALEDKCTLEIKKKLENADEIPDISNLINAFTAGAELKQGTELGHWVIKELIGKGGMSFVYLVERSDKQVQQQAALKVISQGLSNSGLVERFLRERQILTDLNHQNIAKFYDAGVTQQGVPWFVMEYIAGENILEYANSHQLDLEQRIVLFKQVCAALAYAHSKGIVHRDIKPNNLMVDGSKCVKLLDFGIAAQEDEKSVTMTGTVIGTPGYMSPEQAKGLSHEIDRRSDIFSLGVLLYKLISSKMPFVAASISEISYKIIHDEPTLLSNNIASELQAITFKCLEKKVNNRYSSVKKLINDLDAYLNGDVVSAKKVTFFGLTVKKIKKYPLISSIIILALIATISGISYGIFESIASLKKVQLTEKYLAVTQGIKAKVRLMHVLPLHNVVDEYKVLDEQIANLKLEIENSSASDSGLSYFALGSAYLTMRDIEKAEQYFKLAIKKGWESPELYSGLGYCLALDWKQAKKESKAMQGKDREIFITKSKEEFYLPAISYLKKAQKDVVDSNFLAAWMAYIDEDYDRALDFAAKEIEVNPWHYEALRLASEIYLFKFKQTGQKQGWDKAVDLLDLSNEKLEISMNIGRSDPYNYISRCTNASIDIQIKQFLKLDDEIIDSYNKGVTACQNALSLKPDARSPWISLNLLYTNKAQYLESKDLSTAEIYNSALTLIEKGLITNPGDFQLRIYKVSPLLKLAQLAIKENKSPQNHFSKALDAVNEAIEINPEFADSWLQLAKAQKAYGQYFKDIRGDLYHAQSFYLQAIESYQKSNKLEKSLFKEIKIAVVKHNLSQIKVLQQKPLEALSLLQESIDSRLAVIPLRKSYFTELLALLETQVELLQLQQENNQSSDETAITVKQSIENICKLTGISESQKLRLKDFYQPYQCQ